MSHKSKKNTKNILKFCLTFYVIFPYNELVSGIIPQNP